MKNYIVYMHIFPNGKRYVGVTATTPYLRWGANGENYKNIYMKNAIKKYGWNNVEHIIISEGLSVEEAEQMEIEYIKKYNSADRMFGYNISHGGISGKECSEETRKKLHDKNIGKVMSEESKKKISSYQRGQKRTAETKKNMSIAQKKNFANGNNAFHSREARSKAKQKLKGRFPAIALEKATEAKYHAVIDLVSDKEYRSIKDAAAETGLNRSTIIRHCRGYAKIAKWAYKEIDAVAE